MQVYDPWCVCVFVCVQFKLHPRATDSLQATVLWVERTRGRRGRLPPPAGRPDQERILQPPEIQRHWAVRLGKQEVTSSPIKTLRTSCRVVSFRHFSRPLLCRKRGAPRTQTHTDISGLPLPLAVTETVHSWCFNVNILLVSVIYILFSRLYSGTQFVPTVCHHHTVKRPMFGRIRSIKEM